MIFDDKGLEINEYDNDAEVSSLIIECAILDAFSNEEIESVTENTYDLGKAVNEDILVERSIVRLDKEAKKSRAYKMAIFQVAKERKDKDFKKLITLWKLERFIEDKLEKRYAAQAKQLAKESMKKAKGTKSKIVGRAVDKANMLIDGVKSKRVK